MKKKAFHIRKRLRTQAIAVLAGLALSGLGAQTHAAADPLDPYYGNTFISLHDDGVQFIVLWNPDHTFSLTRRGGPDPAAGYRMAGTYTLESGRSCFHVDQPPAGSPTCVPMELGKQPGTVWNTNGRIHELHMIVSGRLPEVEK